VEQQYLPEARRYYEPVDRGYEVEIQKRLSALRDKREPAGLPDGREANPHDP
jgi:replication-associated recombination protein RarA